MEPARVGIIGAGAIAQYHIEALRGLGDVEIVALSNRSAQRREEVAARYHIPATYESHAEMFEHESLDCALVLVSADALYGVTKECIPFGKPLLIEKPPGLSSTEARALADLALRHDTKVQVGYNRRFYSVLEQARVAVESRGPLLGVSADMPERIAQIRALGKFSTDILDHWLLYTHGVDLLRFVGGEVESVRAYAHGQHEKSHNSFAATIAFKNGALGQYVSHWESPGRWQLTLYGEGIRAHLEPLETGQIVIGDETKLLVPEQCDVEYKPGFYKQARYFIDRVRDGGTIERPACSLEDAVRSMELAEAIERGN